MPNYLKIILLEQVFDKFVTLLQGADTNWKVAFVIILNNIEVALLLFFLGITLIAPALIVFSNGLIIGVFFDFIFRLEIFQSGILFSSILSLIPHGIFEIPAFILTASLGVLFILKIFFPNKILKNKTRRNVFYDMILRFAFIIMPLFIFAALIESYISPWVGEQADKYVNNKYQAEYLQEYMPNEIMMAKKHCLIMDKNKVDGNRNLLAANYTQQLQLIFNDDIFREYNKYKDIDKYSQDFNCKEGEEFQIRIWAMDQYMLNHYLALQEETLKGAGLEVTLINKNVYKIKSDIDSYFFAYKEKDEGVYLLVNYFGEDEKLLKKILK